MELLEGLGADEGPASEYVRSIVKEARRSGRSRRGGPRLGLVQERLIIPQPSHTDEADMKALHYIEGRLGIELEPREVEHYKLILCGLYGFLETNGVTELTVKQREADRLNETCIGFLSCDETYIIFRSFDDNFVARGGRRYTNYRIHPWEGSKVFIARADVDALAERHTVVLAEGVFDLIGAERAYYPETRWLTNHVGCANCGSTHGTTLRMLLGLGLLGLDVDLYADNEKGMLEKVRCSLRGAPATRWQAAEPPESPFFLTPGFRARVFQNTAPTAGGGPEKDFGVPAARMRRTEARL
jgi:hypothetical protein